MRLDRGLRRRLSPPAAAVAAAPAPAAAEATAAPAPEPVPPASIPREHKILARVDLRGNGLEIGPSFRPVVPKSAGHAVRVADHADTEALKRKYANVPGALDRIETVDYVIHGSLAAAIPEQAQFDYIVASHVIEHVPDLVGFLKDCELLLKPDGVLALAVPDKRFCFDAARGISSLGEILRAHAQERVRPDRFDVLDYHLNTVKRGEVFGWHPGYREPMSLLYADPAFAAAQAERSAAEYVDVHVWRFTPSSFRLIVEDLNALGTVRLREIYFSGTVDHEFFVSLRAGGDGPGMDRLSMLQAIIAEGKRE